MLLFGSFGHTQLFKKKISARKEVLNGTLSNAPERLYTDTHYRARNIIERSFGSLKQRFKCLMKTRTLYYKHAVAAQIANSCIVLHNIRKLHNLPDRDDEDHEDDADEDEEIQHIEDNDINVVMEGGLTRQELVALIAGRH